jgi:hypothetical protein
MEYWSVGGLEDRSAGVLECWSTGQKKIPGTRYFDTRVGRVSGSTEPAEVRLSLVSHHVVAANRRTQTACRHGLKAALQRLRQLPYRNTHRFDEWQKGRGRED